MLCQPEVGGYGQFGLSVDLSGNSVLIVAPEVNIGGVSSVGAAYLYDLTAANPIAKFQPSDLQFNLVFGRDVKLEGTTAIICSPGVNNFTGAVYVFEVPEPPAGTTALLTASFIAFVVVSRGGRNLSQVAKRQ